MSTTLERPATAGPAPEPPPPAPMRSSRIRWILVGLVVVLVLALAKGILPRRARTKAVATVVAQNNRAPAVSVITIDTAPGASTVILPGSVTAYATTPIYARVPGYIGELRVDIGSRVRRGELLARIDAPELDHQVQQARAVVTQDSASLVLAAVELRRWRLMLTADSAVTLEEVDIHQATYNVALATLNAAIAALRQLLSMQSYERVIAPFDGVITARNIDLGALVGTAGSVNGTLLSGQSAALGSLFELARVDPLRVYVTVPEDNANGIAVGKPAVVTVPSLPGDTLRGHVVRTSNSLDPAARTLLAEVDVPNRKGTYFPGTYAEVQLQLSRPSSTLRLPATALVITAGPPQAVVLGAKSTVQFRTLTLGRDHGSWVEVTDGLVRGEKVVLNPPDLLKNGETVKVVPTAPSTNVASTGG